MTIAAGGVLSVATFAADGGFECSVHRDALSARFFATDADVWSGAGGTDAPGRAQPITLTYSFPDDGAAWGRLGAPTSPAAMTSTFGVEFGVDDVDFGRELVRQGLASWAKFAGISYAQWADDNRPIDDDVGFAGDPMADVGEIRISGTPSTAIGWNSFPVADPNFTSFGGGDMSLGLANFSNVSDVVPLFSRGAYAECDWRGFRNTVAHEHGHGLGFRHPSEEGTYPSGVLPYRVSVMEAGNLPIPRVSQAVMNLPSGATLFDVRGAMHNYGDRFAGNYSLGTATDLGDLTSEGVIFEPVLSTNGPESATYGHADWFRFELTAAGAVQVTLTPQGVEYYDFENETCADATMAGLLSYEFYDEKGDPYLIKIGDPEDPKWEPESFPAGVYYLKVFDTGALTTDATDRVVQMYDLEVRVSPTAERRPFAFAGIDKRIEVGERCYFIGDIHSFATEPGATIVQYDWDLDGNGSFETTDEARPFTTYSSTGTRTVTLRVLDSNGRTAEHSIEVDVVAARPQLFAMDVFEVMVGQEEPVTLFGADLSAVTGIEVVRWDSTTGAFVTAPGFVVDDSSMSVSLDGRTITGVLVEATICAATGRYSIKADTASGPVYLTTAFRVIPVLGDLNGDFKVDFADLLIMIAGPSEPCKPLTPGCDDPNCIENGACQESLYTACGEPAPLTCCYPEGTVSAGIPCCPLDLSGDCAVDDDDMDILLSNYGLVPATSGVTCP